VIATAVIVADQATKLIGELVDAGSTTGAVVPVRNGELSLGVADAPTPVLAALMALGIIVAAAWVLPRVRAGQVAPWAAAALLAGAVSNLADRALLGSVRDFLAVPGMAVLNVADLAVLAGLLGAALSNIRRPHLLPRKEVTP
jgi:signal peptidase II